MRGIAAMAACGLLVACALGCKSSPPVGSSEAPPVTASPHEPKWVSAGGKAFPADVGNKLYGVGVAAANRFPADPFMLRKTAEDRGREEVAGQLRTLVASVIRDYAASAFTPGIKPDEMQSLTEDVQQDVLDATLDNAKPVNSWRDRQTGALYVLTCLSLDAVLPQLRDRIIAAENGKLKSDPAAAHQQLDRIIQQDRKPK